MERLLAPEQSFGAAVKEIHVLQGQFKRVDDDSQCRPPAVRAQQREFRRRMRRSAYVRSPRPLCDPPRTRERAVRPIGLPICGRNATMYHHRGGPEQGTIIEFVLHRSQPSLRDSL